MAISEPAKTMEKTLTIGEAVYSFATLPVEMNLKSQTFFKDLIPHFHANSKLAVIFRRIVDVLEQQENLWEKNHRKLNESSPYYPN